MVLQGRLSPVAVIAIALAVLCALVAGFATLVVAWGEASSWSLTAAFALLLLVQFPLVQLPVLMAYVMLCTCRPDGTIRGRGLAWAAIGLSYVALIWHLVLSAAAEPHLKLAAFGVLAMGAMHLPIFAAESRFAKYAVVMSVIGGTFLSLLFPWLHYSREQSRRLRCADNLRQIGLQFQEAQTHSGLRDLPRGSAWSASDQTSPSSQWFQWISGSSQPAPKGYSIPAESFGVSNSPSVFNELQDTQPPSNNTGP